MSFQSYPLWWSPQNARVSQVQLPTVSSFNFVLKDTKTPLCCSSRLCFVSRSPSRCVCEVQPSPKTHQTRIKLPALSAHPPSYHSGWEMLSSCAPVQPVCGCVLLRVCVQTARPVSWKSEQHSSSKEDSETPHTTWSLPSTTCLLLVIRLRPALSLLGHKYVHTSEVMVTCSPVLFDVRNDGDGSCQW